MKSRHTHAIGRTVVIAVSIGLGLILIILNPLLWWVLPVGAAVGVTIWFPETMLRVLGVTATVAGAIALVWSLASILSSDDNEYGVGPDPTPTFGEPRPTPSLPGGPGGEPTPGGSGVPLPGETAEPEPVPRSQSWGVIRTATATYEQSPGKWVLDQQILIPEESREAALSFLQLFAAGAQEGDRKSVAAEEELVGALERLGWQRAPDQDGALVFDKPADDVHGDVRLYPFTTTHTISLPDIEVFGSLFVFHAAEGSGLVLNGPTNLVMSTEPVSSESRVPAGEQHKVVLTGTSPDTVEIETASPLVRQEPLTTLTRISTAQVAAWVGVGLFGIGLGAFRDRIKAYVNRLMNHRRSPLRGPFTD